MKLDVLDSLGRFLEAKADESNAVAAFSDPAVRCAYMLGRCEIIAVQLMYRLAESTSDDDLAKVLQSLNIPLKYREDFKA